MNSILILLTLCGKPNMFVGMGPMHDVPLFLARMVAVKSEKEPYITYLRKLDIAEDTERHTIEIEPGCNEAHWPAR